MSKHPTRNRLAAWLDTPRGADGRSPAELLEANEINRARLLAIASPSPGLIRAQHWVKQPIPEAFRKGAEHYPEALPPEQVDDLEVSFDDTDHMEDLPTS